MRRVALQRLTAVTAALAVLTACTSTPAVEPATMVARDGKIVTMNPALPEVRALAVRGDRIVAMGTTADVQPFIGPATEVSPELSGVVESF